MLRGRPPPMSVLAAYGVGPPATPLPGGQETAWRAGDLVLKPLDVAPAALGWLSDTLAWLAAGAEVRVAVPVRAGDGALVVDGWTAWPYLPGEHRPGRWLDVVDAGQRLHRLLGPAPCPRWVVDRDDRWALGDRVAFGELPPGPAPPGGEWVVDLLERLRGHQPGPSQLVHADLTGNVLLHDRLPPAVIDLSLTWRPPAFAAAVVVVDALAWEGASPSLADDVGAPFDDFGQHLARALVFRALTDAAADQAPYEPVRRIVDALVGR